MRSRFTRYVRTPLTGCSHHGIGPIKAFRCQPNTVVPSLPARRHSEPDAGSCGIRQRAVKPFTSTEATTEPDGPPGHALIECVSRNVMNYR